MNEEFLKAIYDKYGFENGGISYDQFKSDMEDPALQEAIYKKGEFDKGGISFDQFQADLGMKPVDGTPTQEREFRSGVEDVDTSFQEELYRTQKETDEAARKGQGLKGYAGRRVTQLQKTLIGLKQDAVSLAEIAAIKLGKGEFASDMKRKREALQMEKQRLDAKIPTNLKKSYGAKYIDVQFEGKPIEVQVDNDGKFKTARDKDGYEIDVTKEFVDDFNRYGIGGDASRLSDLVSPQTLLSGLTTAETTLYDLAIMMVGTKGAGAAAKAATKGLTASAAKSVTQGVVRTAVGGIAGFQSLGDNYEENLKLFNGDVDKASNVALTQSAITATITSLFPSIESAGMLDDVAFKDAIRKAALEKGEKTLAQSAMEVAKSVFGEVVEENWDNFAFNYVQAVNGADVDILDPEEIIATTFISALVSAPVAVFNGRGDVSTDNIFVQGLYEAASSKEGRARFDEILNNSNLSDQEKSEKTKLVDKAAANLEAAALDEEKGKELVAAIVNKGKAEAGKSPELVKPLAEKAQAKVEEADAKIEKILNEEPKTETTNKPTQRKLTEDDLEVVFGKGNEGQLILPKDVKITEEMSQELKTELAKISAEVDEGASVMSDKQKKDYSNKVKAKTLEIYNKYAENNKQAETTLDQVTVEPSKNNAGIEVKVDGKAEPKIETKEEVIKTLSNERFGLLTAENPNATKLSEEENAQKNEEARAWLIDKGYEPVEAIGRYNNYENSFMVPGLTREDAVEFANKFDQESVATNEGLVYQDGSFNPRVKGNDNFEITASPEQDFYSTINTAEGPVSFSIGYNFDTRENVSEIPTDQSNLVEKKTKIRELDNTINAPELYGKVIQSLSDEEDNGVIPKSAIGKLRNAFVEDLDNGIGLAQALTRHEARVKNHKRKSIQGELKPKHFPPGMGDQLINQLIEHQKQKRQLLDESADLKTKIDRNKKVSNLIENLFGKPGERSQRSGKSVIPLPRLIDIVANAKKAMSKVLPGVKIKVYKTPESFAKATGVTNPNVGGEYNPKTKTISINASAARETTLAHEIFHAAILSKMGTDAEAQALTKKLIDDIIKDVPPRLRVYLDQFASNYDENIRNEEKLAELGGILAQAYLNGKPTLKSKIMDWVNNLAKRFGLKPFVKNEVYDALRSMSRDIATGVEISNRDFGIISGSDTIIKEDVQALAEGASTYIAEPATINSPRNHYTNVEPIDNSELSFVTSSDLFDIESLISEIADKGEKVWFWVADQLGRGNYFDTLINDEHYLDAGPSYALDPVNRDRKVVWATGKAKRSIDRLIGSSDYIFIISGSPTKSKLFNKRVISLLEKRVGDYKKFKNGLLSSKPTKPIANIINKYDNWNDLKESPDRKELLNAINNTKKLKTRTPLKGFLEDNNAFINLNDLRDGFYKANDFKLNDIMLVLKPKQFGGKSNHSTYNYDILGDVIGVPNKKINAFDIMPNDIRSRYEETLNNIQKSQVVAPYGSGIRNIDSSNISNRYQMSAENPNIGEDAIPNMTEDGNGNFVFYHYSDLKLNKIDPEKFGLNSKTSRAERADLVGAPHAFFYTVPNFAEQGVGDIQHQVKIPKDKVYDATKDPRGFYDEAKKQFKNLRGEQMAFNPNAQIAWISKVASENGYEMSIARWGLDPNDGNYLRAQSPMIKTPEAKNGEYKSNLQKGITVESQITKADENLNDVYQEISDYRDEQGNYDDLYSLREQAFYGFEDKYSPFPDQESITNAIMSSDIPQSLKNKYQKAIKSEGVTINKKPGTRYSINPSETTKVENIITQFPDIEVNELTDMLKPYIPKINSYDVKKIKDQVENGISQNAPGWQGNPPKNGPQPFRGRVANIPQQPGMDEDGNMLLKTKDINDIREYFDLEEYNTNTKTYEALIEESRQFMSTDAEMFARETKVVYDILNGGETSNLDAKMIAIRVAIDKLQNILNVQKGLLESATNKSDELMYQRNVDSLEADIHDFTTAYNRIGTVGGRILRFRQNQLKSDFYSPNRLRRLMRDANNGENLTKEQEVEVEKASGSLKELQKKVDQLYSEDILRNESLLQEFAKKAINQKIKDSKKTFRRKPKNLLTVNDAKSNLDNILKNGPC